MTTGFVAGEDVLGFTNQNGITGSYDAATGVLTLTGVATKSAWESALASVTYTNSSDSPTGSTRTVSFRVHDGTVLSVAATRSVGLTAVDDTPVLTTGGGSTPWSEGNVTASVPVPIDPSLTVADADTPDLGSATVAITSGLVAGEDVLAFTKQNGITATYDSGTGVLSLTGPATSAQWQSALRSVTYDNTADSPSTTPARGHVHDP